MSSNGLSFGSRIGGHGHCIIQVVGSLSVLVIRLSKRLSRCIKSLLYFNPILSDRYFLRINIQMHIVKCTLTDRLH